MAAQGSNEDRRRERRYAVAGRVAWRRATDEAPASGWLSDASGNSFSFITSAEGAPSHGEQIEIQDHRVWPPLKVTRVAAYDANTTLVACRSHLPLPENAWQTAAPRRRAT